MVKTHFYSAHFILLFIRSYLSDIKCSVHALYLFIYLFIYSEAGAMGFEKCLFSFSANTSVILSKENHRTDL